MLRKDQAFFDRNSKGDLIGRLTLDVATLQNTLSDLIGQRGLRSLLEVLGPMLIIAWRQPVLAIITCCVTPVLSRALRSVVVRSTKLSYERQEVASAALEFASERLSHVQIVQVGALVGRKAALQCSPCPAGAVYCNSCSSLPGKASQPSPRAATTYLVQRVQVMCSKGKAAHISVACL